MVSCHNKNQVHTLLSRYIQNQSQQHPFNDSLANLPSVSWNSRRRVSGGHLGCGRPAGKLRLRGRAFWRSRCRPGSGGSRWSPAAMTQAEKGDAENGKEKGGEKEKEQRGVKRPIVPALVPESLQEVRRRGRVSVRAPHFSPRSCLPGLGRGGWRPAEGFGPSPSCVVQRSLVPLPDRCTRGRPARKPRALRGQEGSFRGP